MRKLIEQIMKFGVVGVIAFVIDFGVMVFLTEGFGIDPVISATVSFIISVIFNYAASMRYVFSHREGMSRTRVRDPQDLSRGRRVLRATRGKSRLRWMRARSSLRLSRIAV